MARDKLGADGARALAQLLNQLGKERRDAAITLAEERPRLVSPRGDARAFLQMLR